MGEVIDDPMDMANSPSAEGVEFDGVNLSIFGKECTGCVNHNKDIMISFIDSENYFIDIFLTQEKAIEFQQLLSRQIAFNELDI